MRIHVGWLALVLAPLLTAVFLLHNQPVVDPFTFPSEATRQVWRLEGTEVRTPCTSACIEHFYLDPTDWNYCQCVSDMVTILRKDGWCVEIITTDCESVGVLLDSVPPGIFLVAVENHVLLIEGKRVVVDTCPQPRYEQEVQGLYHIYRPYY